MSEVLSGCAVRAAIQQEAADRPPAVTEEMVARARAAIASVECDGVALASDKVDEIARACLAAALGGAIRRESRVDAALASWPRDEPSAAVFRPTDVDGAGETYAAYVERTGNRATPKPAPPIMREQFQYDARPAPDAVREAWNALARLRSITPTEFKAYHSCVDLFETALRALAAPVPSLDGAGEREA